MLPHHEVVSWTFGKISDSFQFALPLRKSQLQSIREHSAFPFLLNTFLGSQPLRGTMFDFFLSLVRVETETLAKFPRGDWMQFSESRQARPGC